MLYALLPEEFVAERAALAARARTEGDRVAAAAIRRLGKPSQPAWQVNLLVREHPDVVDELAATGATLRAAAQSGDPREVRRVNAERQSVVSQLADRAGQLADAAGKATTAATRREVESTLQAALSSPGAAEQVATGRLVVALFDTGLDAVGLLTLPPAPPPGDRTPSRAAPQVRTAAHEPPGDDRAADARAALEAASQALAEADAEAARTRARADQAAEELSQLEARISATRRRSAQAQDEASRAERTAAAARGAQESAAAAYAALGGSGSGV